MSDRHGLHALRVDWIEVERPIPKLVNSYPQDTFIVLMAMRQVS